MPKLDVPTPGHSLSVSLLCDIAPEVALRWLPFVKHSFPPTLPRALFSLMIRTTSETESLAAKDVLLHLQTLKQSSALCCLGFATKTEKYNREKHFSEVLYDLLLSASRDEALMPSGKALSFYNDAGPGSGDADEYFSDTPDHRVPHAYSHLNIAQIRSRNLANAIDVYTEAFNDDSCFQAFVTLANHGIARFLAPLVDQIPEVISVVPIHLKEAIFKFYNAYARSCPAARQQEMRTRLVAPFMRVAGRSVHSLNYYIQGIENLEIRFQATRLCLIQRFGVEDSVDEALIAPNIVKYIFLDVEQCVHPKAVPCLVSTMLMAWYQIAPKEAFKCKESDGNRNMIRLLSKLKKAKLGVGKYGCPKHDEIVFRTVMLTMSWRILETQGKAKTMCIEEG